jgi:small nuclear ribonucleoprotein (snRNP)-like protein
MDEIHDEEEDTGEDGFTVPEERHGPPPEFTGAEAAYLFRNKEARSPMVVRLADGEDVRGIIEYYDRDMVKINRTEGPNLFIRKSQIRYMHRE